MSLAKPRQTRETDWQAIRQSLERTKALMEANLDYSSKRSKAVMDERARLLAQPTESSDTADEYLEVLSFDLADESYCIEVRFVRELLRLAECIPVPGTPDFVVGLTNLHGEILAVFDLRPSLNVDASEARDTSRVIVLGEDRAEFGMLADATHEVGTVRADEIIEMPEYLHGIGREYLLGATECALGVLDGAKILAHGRLYVTDRDARVQSDGY